MYQSWVEISSYALKSNLKMFQRLVGTNKGIMPIIKSNAYGHGMIPTAKLLSNHVEWFGVANTEEAMDLRRAGIKNKLFCLSYFDPANLVEAINHRIDLPVYDEVSVATIGKAAKKSRIPARVHLKIDTGATRIGVLPSDAKKILRRLKSMPNVRVEGVYSHFASSESDSKYTAFQLQQFSKLLSDPVFQGIKSIHFACTAAMVTQPSSRYTLGRLGLGLYGLWPSKTVRRSAMKNEPWLNLLPVLKWKARVIQVKKVSKGTKIGYGGTYIAKRPMRIAVISVGYWDGYDRGLSNTAMVSVHGIACKIVGRICMNISMIDVTNVPNTHVGDEVELLGNTYSVEDMAAKLRTINYEVVTRINPLLPRVLVK